MDENINKFCDFAGISEKFNHKLQGALAPHSTQPQSKVRVGGARLHSHCIGIMNFARLLLAQQNLPHSPIPNVPIDTW